MDTTMAFLDFLKTLTLEVIAKNALNKFGMFGLPGLLIAAGEAAAVTAVFSGLKAAITKGAEGGPVGGRSHAQGGTLMELEQGEFITKKSAVDYYGSGVLEAINRQLVPKNLLSGFNVQATRVSSFAASGGIASVTGQGPTSIVNFTDPLLMERYLSTVGGQKAIINVISANSRIVRRVLG
jgi:hypothetical protein